MNTSTRENISLHLRMYALFVLTHLLQVTDDGARTFTVAIEHFYIR
uniref:Uncharacterized protein n=1 Tax=Setaria viridis TaxID=4556 RepID=A0A4U6V7R2_SETVI|nr:hypothetical protein SEVIR_4G264901v2 [Setaria viridis]